MFKGFCLFIFSIILIFLTTIVYSLPLFTLCANTYEVYFGDSAGEIRLIDKKFIPLGVKGEGVQLNRQGFDIDLFLKENRAKLKVIRTENGGTSYYAFSKKIPYKVRVFERTVNLHVFICNEYVKVGAPIIFGSF